MGKPIFINPDHFRPLDSKEWNGPCSSCGKPRARWMFTPADEGKTGSVSVCGLCWLYESGWGVNRTKELFEFMMEVEKETGAQFLKSKRKLVRCEDADRLLGVLALTSKLFQIQATAKP